MAARVGVTVIGLGLIGGSALRAFDRAGLAPRGYDADPATRRAARSAPGDAVIADDLAGALDGADVALLAVPLPVLGDVLAGLIGFTGLITDATSVKLPVADAVAARLPGARFVGGHPMAGREHAGFAAGDAALFDDAAWVLCLEPDTDLGDWLTVARLVTAIGARVVPTDAADHDAAVARISHVPHLTAAAVAAAAGAPLPATLAAGSFRDGTRVAAAPPTLSAAICGGNPGPVAAALDEVIADLTRARALLAGADPIGELTDWFERGHDVRRAWPPVPGEAGTLPADRAALLALGAEGGWITGVDGDTVRVVRPDPR